MPEELITSADAIIDNGRFGKRTITFETGRLARQAAGSTYVTLDGETALLSATTASMSPRAKASYDRRTMVSFTAGSVVEKIRDTWPSTSS